MFACFCDVRYDAKDSNLSVTGLLMHTKSGGWGNKDIFLRYFFVLLASNVICMATALEKTPPRKTENNANQTHYYVTLAIAVAIGLAGTFLRFLQDSALLSAISNILLAIGWFIVFRVVFRIMK